MAWYRQASQPWQAGVIDSSMNGDQRVSVRIHDHGPKGHSGLARTRSWKGKKVTRLTSRNRQFSIAVFVVLLLVAMTVTFSGADYFAVLRTLRGEELPSGLPGSHDEENLEFNESKEESIFLIKKENGSAEERESDEYTERESGKFWQANIGRQSGNDDEKPYSLMDKEEGFHQGQGLDEISDTDWRNWDKDDRRRERLGLQRELTVDLENFKRSEKLESNEGHDIRVQNQGYEIIRTDSSKSAGSDSERARIELHKDKEQFEDELREEPNSSQEHSRKMNRKEGEEGTISLPTKRVPGLDEDLDSGKSIRSLEEGKNYEKKEFTAEGVRQLGDTVEDEYNDDGEEGGYKNWSASQQEKGKFLSHLEEEKSNDKEDRVQGTVDDINKITSVGDDPMLEEMHSENHLDVHRSGSESSIRPGDAVQDMSRKGTTTQSKSSSKESYSAFAGVTQQSNDDSAHSEKEEDYEKVTGKARKKNKHPATACEIAFRNTTSGLQEPTDMSIFQHFSLSYVQNEEKPEDDSAWKPKFAGHQSLLQREASYLAEDQTLHCGFVEGPDASPETGFELSKDDKDYLQTCHIAVSSCIFGNYDRIRTPQGRKVSSSSKENVCFAMFVDQQSLDGMIEDGEVPDGNMTRGLWRIVLIKNLPYSDNRRTGKVPKFLTHRLFPNAKYSIWLDSKLRLQSDPLLILEHFLWQGKHEYAISNHYDRHCVWEEVAQNKKLNKFSHSVIDDQFEFYQKDGLTRFNASDPNKILPSHVPEGSFIVRAHTPMSNLFSCLWFNEVERFTPRDQLSFAYTYLKLVRTNPSRHFRFHMFKDCERREMTKLFHHKQEGGRR